MKNVAREGRAEPIPTRGLQAVEFICPRCSGRRWGTYRPLEGPELGEHGICGDRACAFTWPRDLDWLFMHRKVDGSAFASPTAYDVTIGVPLEIS